MQELYLEKHVFELCRPVAIIHLTWLIELHARIGSHITQFQSRSLVVMILMQLRATPVFPTQST